MKIVHDSLVVEALSLIKKKQDELMELGQLMLAVSHNNVCSIDWLAISAIKKTLNNSQGFEALIQSWNMQSARSLLKDQIDVFVRFSAIWLVENPKNFAAEVIEGKSIEHMSCKAGAKMTDNYLVSLLTFEHPWLSDVHQSLSNFVHHSEKNYFSNAKNVVNERAAAKQFLDKKNIQYPVSFWLEIVECYNDSLDVFIKYLGGWVAMKENF